MQISSLFFCYFTKLATGFSYDENIETEQRARSAAKKFLLTGATIFVSYLAGIAAVVIGGAKTGCRHTSGVGGFSKL